MKPAAGWRREVQVPAGVRFSFTRLVPEVLVLLSALVSGLLSGSTRLKTSKCGKSAERR